jgi:predicted MPP superfamily phosphohydrolase
MIERAIVDGIEQKPDFIVVTGDFITHGLDFDYAGYASILKRLSGAAPAFAVLGNHDTGTWVRSGRGHGELRTVDRLAEAGGLELLHNRSRCVSVRDQRLNIAGVGDLWSREVDGAKAFRDIDRRAPVLLLAHNPDSKDVLRGYAWDLMLAGHTHGGQVIVPFQGPKYAPVKDKRFVAGLGAWEGRQIYVTRGVGNLGGVRFCCRPEVSILNVTV